MKKNSKEKTARVYSTALYEAAAGTNQLAAVKKDAEFLLELCGQDNDLLKKSSSPLLSDEERKDIWRQVSAKVGFNNETAKCLDILTENRRIGDLAAIMQDFIHLYYAGENIDEVKVETVKKLSAAQDKRLREVLKAKSGKDVVIGYIENPSLLGGLRIQNGSKMFDGSLIHKLNCLENIMKGK